MPKGNIRGGKTFKKNKSGRVKINKEMIYADSDPSFKYAIVTKKFGGSQLGIDINEGPKEVRGRISGSMQRRDYMNIGDIILVSARDDLTSDKTYDILYKYTPEQTIDLKKKKLVSFEEKEVEDDDGIDFQDDSEDDSINFEDI